MSKIDELIERKQKIEQGGGQDKINEQHASGKLFARERIGYLLDEGSFVEVDAFAKGKCKSFNAEASAEGVVTGYGTIDGRLVFVYLQDYTVLNGSLGEVHAKKISRIMDMAEKMGAPIIGLLDSGGARIQEGVDVLSGYGQIFHRNVRLSGVVPQISVVLGPCTGGAAFSPALTDFVFMVQNVGKMYINGTEMIKAATGVEVTGEELGGAITHSTESGIAHFAPVDEMECFREVRRLLGFLPSNNIEPSFEQETGDDLNRIIPEFDYILPENPYDIYDVRDIVERLVDRGEFLEVHALYAQNVVTGFGRLNGRTVGIVANQPANLAGSLDINGSDKASRFIRTCDAFNIPILTLVDVPGFLPGTNQELSGIIRHSAKLIYAYSEATVPKVTVILRKAYGSACVAMGSKELGTDIVYAWPTAEIAVTGPEMAASAVFKDDIASSLTPEEDMNIRIKQYRNEIATPYFAAESGYVDDVIIPSESRQRIIAAFEMLGSKRDSNPPRKHGNIPV